MAGRIVAASYLAKGVLVPLTLAVLQMPHLDPKLPEYQDNITAKLNSVNEYAVDIGLYLIGVPNAILRGILAAALRFISYVGPWISAAIPIGLSMAIAPAGWRPSRFWL